MLGVGFVIDVVELGVGGVGVVFDYVCYGFGV